LANFHGLADRGEAANHGIYDAAAVVYQLVQWRNNDKTLQQAMQDYQTEVVNRTNEAVFLSRSSCLECHDIDTLSTSSAIFQVSGFNANVREDRPVLILDAVKETNSFVGHELGVKA
jgi:2-polyprenyl-6-methoxyphenol hydroxylase-like FAD-dependent oxidoreductase